MASVKIGNKAVGDIVKIKVNGALKNFIVVHQGKPGTMYDSSCDGTWLLMEDIYEQRQWHTSNVNDYEKSDIHSYLNSTFLGLIDTKIASQIKSVKLPYRKGQGYDKAVTSGASGLTAKVFLLSSEETAFVHDYMPTGEGAVLTYFKGCAPNSADNKRVAKYSGNAAYWWLRSPYCGSSYGATYALYVSSNGNWYGHDCSSTYGVRPALILPSSLLVSDDGSVSVNTAPTMPATITVPETVNGGSAITVSWAASTDPENNLAGYIVERTTNGGNNWTQIYQSTAAQCTDTVPFGSETVQYRVKAYDTENLASSWKVSEQRSVFNNTAPTAPGSITVPVTPVGGEALTISWGASTDAEENLQGYRLERKHDAVDFEQIYQGTGTTYQDTIEKGWKTVQYRVKAYDKAGLESAYATSDPRTVDNNTAPAITCADHPNNSDLGEKEEGFTIGYSVSDPDGDTITVTEAVDGATKRSYSPADASPQNFEVTGDYFMGILNGPHTLTITAKDDKGKQAVHTLKFTKAVYELSIANTTPMETDALITKMVMSVVRSIPEDAEFKVLVTNNAKDDSPVWEDATQAIKSGLNYLFTNETATKGNAFSFKITAKRREGGQGGYISSIGGAFE